MPRRCLPPGRATATGAVSGSLPGPAPGLPTGDAMDRERWRPRRESPRRRAGRGRPGRVSGSYRMGRRAQGERCAGDRCETPSADERALRHRSGPACDPPVRVSHRTDIRLRRGGRCAGRLRIGRGPGREHRRHAAAGHAGTGRRDDAGQAVRRRRREARRGRHVRHPGLRVRAARRHAPRLRRRAGRTDPRDHRRQASLAALPGHPRQGHQRRRAGAAVDGVRPRLRQDPSLLRQLHRPQRYAERRRVPPLEVQPRPRRRRQRAARPALRRRGGQPQRWPRHVRPRPDALHRHR